MIKNVLRNASNALGYS